MIFDTRLPNTTSPLACLFFFVYFVVCTGDDLVPFWFGSRSLCFSESDNFVFGTYFLLTNQLFLVRSTHGCLIYISPWSPVFSLLVCSVSCSYLQCSVYRNGPYKLEHTTLFDSNYNFLNSERHLVTWIQNRHFLEEKPLFYTIWAFALLLPMDSFKRSKTPLFPKEL